MLKPTSVQWATCCPLLLLVSMPVPGSVRAADPSLEAYLAYCDASYSEEHHMLGQEFSSPGYHTTVSSGTWVHPTRQSLDYALALLERNGPGDADRAARIVGKVLRLQDVDPESHTYGIWPWLLEEPLEKMSPPDWNWADFCGARIAQMLVDHPAKLPADLVATMRESLGHAARAIRKRNVGPNYTNIAIMGGGVCAAAGELLDDVEMLQYGRQRLQKVVEHAAYHGGFNEYNSPTYTAVALWECERTLALARDPATREAAESLRRAAWQVIADSFHPGTQQWAGPHSRAYADRISPGLAEYVSRQTGVEVRAHPSGGDGDGKPRFDAIRHLPAPSDFIPRFRRLPSDPLEIRRTFIRGDSEESSTIGTTWHTADACLGSVNRSSLWTQRRPLVAYWKTDEDPAVVFRLRFLHDGRDFASMGVSTKQRGGRVLSVFYPLRDQGDWHPTLDRPADGTFQAADFRVRYELQGKGVGAGTLDEGRFELRAGGRRAVVYALPGRFADRPIVWQVEEDGDRVLLDGICYQGAKRDFDFRALKDVALVAGVELLRADEPVAEQPPKLTQTEPGLVEARWDVAGVQLSATASWD